MEFPSLFLSLILLTNILRVDSAYKFTGHPEYEGDRAWLRLCTAPNGDEKNTLGASAADKCSSGYWFKEPLKVGCACGHGVWVFAKGWCDKTARVVVAYNGTCFSVDKEVRYIRNIGYSNQAFMPYHFQATSGFEFVQELPMGFEYTYSHPNYDQHIGSIFRARDIESANSKRCLDTHYPVKKAFALKYFTDKMPYHQVDECFSVAGQPNTYQYDDEFDLNHFFVLREKSKDPLKPLGPQVDWDGNGTTKCVDQCLGDSYAHTTANPIKTSTVPADYVDPLNYDYFPYDHNMTNSNKTNQTCDYSMKTYSLTNKTVREIKEQTKRMIMANLGNALKGIATPEVEVKDYVYFQMARNVLLQVCPNEEVPHSLVTGLLRMFRVAVKESLRFYPYVESGDGNLTKRITDGLKACLASTRPFTYEYKNSSDGSECPTEFNKVEYTYSNTVNRTLHTSLPCELETDVKQLDLPIETAWKTVMFTHYYCARHFATNLTDYTLFYVKMEQFFNRWIQHRWYYPGSSIKAYEYVFQSYDLDKFAKNLDRCIAASRSFSSFRNWIKRPVYMKNCGGNLFQDMSDSPEDHDKTKLDAITPKLTEFDGKAYCLPYWHSPASNPGINYDPSKDVSDGCVTYNKEEWEDDMTPNPLWSNQI